MSLRPACPSEHEVIPLPEHLQDHCLCQSLADVRMIPVFLRQCLSHSGLSVILDHNSQFVYFLKLHGECELED